MYESNLSNHFAQDIPCIIVFIKITLWCWVSETQHKSISFY